MRTIDPYTPIVFFSGAAHIEDHSRGLAAGATAYVSKPDVDGLLQTIAPRRLVNEWSLTGEPFDVHAYSALAQDLERVWTADATDML
jgi:CheY-like chemotaxis protein